MKWNYTPSTIPCELLVDTPSVIHVTFPIYFNPTSLQDALPVFPPEGALVIIKLSIPIYAILVNDIGNVV